VAEGVRQPDGSVVSARPCRRKRAALLIRMLPGVEVVPLVVEVEAAVLPSRPLVLGAFGADPAKIDRRTTVKRTLHPSRSSRLRSRGGLRCRPRERGGMPPAF